ncbi:MAG: hypothetical protein JWO46_506 [Nocardioidaceae bacterium]|nr:hypothetical protein [Nocardioidaceae bacterium]
MTQPQQPPIGTVRLHLQGSVLTRTIAPSVSINGQFVPVKFGVNDLPVYAGPVTIHAQTQWLRVYGQADLSFQVLPGSLTEVWYAIPMHQFTRGAMGFEKQKSPGKGVLAAVLLGILVLLVLIVLAGLLL